MLKHLILLLHAGPTLRSGQEILPPPSKAQARFLPTHPTIGGQTSVNFPEKFTKFAKFTLCKLFGNFSINVVNFLTKMQTFLGRNVNLFCQNANLFC